MAYLHPFGSTKPEDVEFRWAEEDYPKRRGPLFIFYDQEPLDFEFNRPLFDSIVERSQAPYILVSTEQISEDKNRILEHYPFADIDYFFHIFAAADWYRGHEYLPGLVLPEDRVLKKTYITLNRLTSNKRVYRSLLVNELYKQGLIDKGYVSFSKDCPDGGNFVDNLRASKINPALVEQAITNINSLPDLRVDFSSQDIPNQSMLLTPMSELMASFLFLVTETCFFESKTHLTEKIFKPIVLRMPFVLLGPAHSLKYLRSYGFKTFSDFWDESYDDIEDGVARLEAAVQVVRNISEMNLFEQQQLLVRMRPILEHNYQRFADGSLVREEWNKLTYSLKEISKLYQFNPPYRPNPKLGQAIPL